MEAMSTQDVTFNDLNWKIEYDPEKCTMWYAQLKMAKTVLPDVSR